MLFKLTAQPLFLVLLLSLVLGLPLRPSIHAVAHDSAHAQGTPQCTDLHLQIVYTLVGSAGVFVKTLGAPNGSKLQIPVPTSVPLIPQNIKQFATSPVAAESGRSAFTVLAILMTNGIYIYDPTTNLALQLPNQIQGTTQTIQWLRWFSPNRGDGWAKDPQGNLYIYAMYTIVDTTGTINVWAVKVQTNGMSLDISAPIFVTSIAQASTHGFEFGVIQKVPGLIYWDPKYYWTVYKIDNTPNGFSPMGKQPLAGLFSQVPQELQSADRVVPSPDSRTLAFIYNYGLWIMDGANKPYRAAPATNGRIEWLIDHGHRFILFSNGNDLYVLGDSGQVCQITLQQGQSLTVGTYAWYQTAN